MRIVFQTFTLRTQGGILVTKNVKIFIAVKKKYTGAYGRSVPKHIPHYFGSTYLDTYNNYHEHFYPRRFATNHSFTKAAPRTFFARVRPLRASKRQFESILMENVFL